MMDFTKFIYDFQTLLTGIAAVLIGGASIWLLRKQIFETRQQFAEQLKESERQFDLQIAEAARKEEDVLARRLRAARAALPNSISEVSQYAEQCCRVLFRGLERHRLDGPVQMILDLPTFPHQAFDRLVPIIEAATVEDAQALADFIALGQVQRSRLEALANRLSANPDRPTLIIASSSYISSIRDALGLYAFTDRIFPYARGQTESIGDFYGAAEASSKLQINIGIHDPEVYQGVMRPWPPSVQFPI